MADAKRTKECIHCGTVFRARSEDERFCCGGCEYVHGMIRGGDLEKFYELRSNRKLAPAGDAVFRRSGFEWLPPLVEEAEAAGDSGRLTLSLQGISCIGCVWLVEKLFDAWPGALDVQVRATDGELTLRWESGGCDIAGFAERLRKFGYLVGPPRRRDGGAELPASRKLLWRVGACAAFAMNAMLFTLPFYLGMSPEDPNAWLFDLMTVLFATAAFLVGGGYFIRRTWGYVRHGGIHIDLPIALGLVIAYAASLYGMAADARGLFYFDFVAIFSFLMLLGRWVQEVAIERNRKRLLEHRVQVNAVETVGEGGEPSGNAAPEALTQGVVFRVRPGDYVPVRSRVRSDAVSMSLAWINGESDPAVYHDGATVPSGARHIGKDRAEFEALEGWDGSLLSALLTEVADAERRNPGRERFIRAYLMAVVLVALAGGTFWAWGAGFEPALQVAVSILVVSCPCAIGVALPLAEEIAVQRLRRDGVFVRRADLFGRIRQVGIVALDKTGTLTLDNAELDDPAALDGLDAASAGVVFAMASSSLHPVSVCLHDALILRGAEAVELDALKEIPGMGMEAVIGGRRYRLGRPSWACKEGGGDGFDCAFTCDGQWVKGFRFHEVVRQDAEEQVATLQSMGRSIHILSGDRAEKVAAMARRLGVPESHAHGGMTPGAKAEWIVSKGTGQVCMIGDGANDSLAFNEAACTGTPAIDRGLLENKSDFYFTGRSLAGVGRLFESANRHHLSIRRVLAFSIAYNLVAVAVCLAGWMNPLVAAILMPLSSVATLAIVWASR